MTTSVRIPVADWEWVKKHPRMEFSALMAAKIHELQLDESSTPTIRFVREARKFGLTDTQIQAVITMRTEPARG